LISPPRPLINGQNLYWSISAYPPGKVQFKNYSAVCVICQAFWVLDTLGDRILAVVLLHQKFWVARKPLTLVFTKNVYDPSYVSNDMYGRAKLDLLRIRVMRPN